MQIVRELRYPPAARDAEAMVAAMLEARPEVLCWCSAEPHMVHALTEAAWRAGFDGPILSATADNYQRLVARTSTSFMENFTFNFPDFDDPALAGTAFFFRQPAGFHASYHDRFPGQWSAVSWEYAAVLDLWHAAVEIAGTTDPLTVLEAMKRGGQMPHNEAILVRAIALRFVPGVDNLKLDGDSSFLKDLMAFFDQFVTDSGGIHFRTSYC